MNRTGEVCWMVCCGAAAWFGAACGQDLLEAPAGDRVSVTLQWDNDVFWGTDNDYTNGLRLGFTWELDEPAASGAQRMLFRTAGGGGAPLVRMKSLDPAAQQWDFGVSLSQLMYTPTSKAALIPPPGQRPFAGWAGLAFSAHAKDDDAISSAALAVGVTGEYSLAENAQDAWHDLFGWSKFHGWDSQVPTEVTVNLFLDRKQRYGFLDDLGPRWFEIDGHFEYGASLGNFRTSGYVGSLFRAGFHLPASYPAPRLDVAAATHKLFLRDDPDADWSLYFFGGVRGHAVAHDITLDGPVFRGYAHEVDSKPLVGELVWGLGARYKWVELALSSTVRTDEFDGQRENHQYNSALLRVSF